MGNLSALFDFTSDCQYRITFLIFLTAFLAAPRPTLSRCQGSSLTHLMLVTVFLHVRPEGHQEPHKEVEALSLAEDLVGFELETFQF